MELYEKADLEDRWYKKGMQYFNQGEYVNALESLKEVQIRFPHNVRIVNDIGFVYMKMDN